MTTRIGKIIEGFSIRGNDAVAPKLSVEIHKAIKSVAPDFKYTVRMHTYSGGISAYIKIKNWVDFAEYAKSWDPDFDDVWDVKSWKKLESIFGKIIDKTNFKPIEKEFPGFDSDSVRFEFMDPNGSSLGED